MKDSFFFITGRGRSGTWLLKSVLDSHSKLCVTPESLFVETLYHKYYKITNWTKEIKISFFKDLIEDDRIAEWWRLDHDKLKSRILNQSSKADFAEFCLIPYNLYADQNGKSDIRYIGDKNPGYTLRLNTLLELYPSSKVIIMVRDPRDNISSYSKVNFDMNNPVSLAVRWNFYMKKIKNIIEAYGSRVKVFKFEDLILKPEDTLRDICNHLEVEFEIKMMTFYENPKNVLEWNKKITNPFDPSATYKWLETQDSAVNKKITGICKKYISYLGYQTLTDCKSLSLIDYWHWFKAMIVNNSEYYFFYVPLSIKKYVIRLYRRKTKSL